MQKLESVINKDNEKVLTEFIQIVEQLSDSADENLNKLINSREKTLLIPRYKKNIFEKMLDVFYKIQTLPDSGKINEILINDEASGEFWNAIFQYVKGNNKIRDAINPAIQCTYEEYEKNCKDFFENNIKYNGISELEYDMSAYSKLFRVAEEFIIINRESKALFQSTMKEQLGLDSARSNILWELFDSNREWIMQYKTIEYIQTFIDYIKNM